MSLRRTTLALIAVLLLAACASSASTPATPEANTLPDRALGTPARTVSPGQAPSSLTQLAIDDLASRLGADAAKIEVIAAEAVTWSDGGLGCPEPGVAYIQVMVEGYRMVLEHEGRAYDYRSDGRRVRLCESPLPIGSDVQRTIVPQWTAVPLTTIAPVDLGSQAVAAKPTADLPPGLQVMVDQALADLSNRLSISSDNVEVVTAETVVWPDSSLGCPQPGMEYLQVQAEGARIELRVKDRIYDYHSGEIGRAHV